MLETTSNISELDVEWLQLIIEARNLGIEKKEVLDYLINNGINIENREKESF